MSAKMFEIEELDLAEFLEEVEDKSPVYIYTYDGEYVMVSTVEIDPDDLEELFERKIADLENDDD